MLVSKEDLIATDGAGWRVPWYISLLLCGTRATKRLYFVMPSLPKDVAAEIALQWANRLTAGLQGGSLALRSVRNELLPVLEVTVSSLSESPDDPEELRENLTINTSGFTALCETLAVWRALACCRGFGGCENPQFWDQVVRQFVANSGGEIEEECRYSFHDEKADPSRVTLRFGVQGSIDSDDSNKQRVLNWMRNVCRRLFQVNELLGLDVQDTLTRLQPFIDKHRSAEQRVSVDLLFRARRARRGFYVNSYILETYTSIVNEIWASQRDSIAAPTKNSPLLCLRKIEFGAVGISTAQDLRALFSALAKMPLPMRNLWLPIDLDFGSTPFSEFVTGVFALNDLSPRRAEDQLSQTGKLQSLSYLIASLNPHRFACLFSALPYAHSLQRLHLFEIRRQRQWTVSKLECWWMVYAFFHPRTTTSSWHGLELQDGKFGDDARDVFREIQANPIKALSITRLAVLGGIFSSDEARSNQLQIATVKSSANVYTKSNAQADVLTVLGRETELEMCDVHRDGWFCVLIPGYSFGWVQQTEVASTREWIPQLPLSPSLKVLSLGRDFQLENSLLLLSGIGNSIKSLTLGKFSTSGSILDDLTLRCPNLKSLTLEGLEDWLSRDSLERFFSQTTGCLESLTVDLERSNFSVLVNILANWTDKKAVKSLKKLHLANISYHRFYEDQMASCETMLRANQSLEQLYFSFIEESHAFDMRTPGAELESHNGEDIYRSQRMKQRWAFLSVVKYQSKNHRQSAFSRLDSAVVAIVFKFAVVRTRRIVYLPPGQWEGYGEDE